MKMVAIGSARATILTMPVVGSSGQSNGGCYQPFKNLDHLSRTSHGGSMQGHSPVFCPTGLDALENGRTSQEARLLLWSDMTPTHGIKRLNGPCARPDRLASDRTPPWKRHSIRRSGAPDRADQGL